MLELLAEGLTNRQIGERLHLAEKTVKNYVTSVLSKLGMTRRTEAAVYAVRHHGAITTTPLGERHRHSSTGPPRLASAAASNVPAEPARPGDAMFRSPLPVARRASAGPDAVVLDAQRESSVASRRIAPRPSLGVRVTGDVRQRLAEHDHELVGDAVVGHASRSARRRTSIGSPIVGRCQLGDEREHSLAQASAPELDRRLEGEDRRADPLDRRVEVVDRELDPARGLGSSSRRIVAWSDRPTANSCWMTVSWRSIAMRSRSSSRRDVPHPGVEPGVVDRDARPPTASATTSSSSMSVNASSERLSVR